MDAARWQSLNGILVMVLRVNAAFFTVVAVL
jgi:hypothetical protein